MFFNAVFVPRLQLNYGCKNDFAKLRFSTLSIVIIQLGARAENLYFKERVENHMTASIHSSGTW